MRSGAERIGWWVDMVAVGRADTIWTCNPLTVAGLRFNTLWEERTQRVWTLYVPVLLRLHCRQRWFSGSFRGFPPSRTWTLATRLRGASMPARLGGSRLGLAFGLLVCSTLALYEEPPGGCAGPADDDLLQPPKAIQRSPRPPPPKAPPPAEPDEDDSQAELQRQVCVCAARRSPSTDAHLSRTRAIWRCS